MSEQAELDEAVVAPNKRALDADVSVTARSASAAADKPTASPTADKGRPWKGVHVALALAVGLGVGGAGGYVAKWKVFPDAKAPAREPQPGAYVPPAAWTPREGPANAKVTIVEFFDFQCPHCSRVSPTLKEVVKAYDGQVAVHARHFPLSSHKSAEPAARAMQAAHLQGKAFEMADKMFANMKALSDDDLAKYAEEVGLDVGKFKADFASDEIKDQVAKDTQAGRDAGVRGTPSIFVNGKRYEGPRTLDGFKPLIDSEIKAADELVKAGTSIENVHETRAKLNAAK